MKNKVFEASEASIKKLEKDIKYYHAGTQRSNPTSNAYYMKGKALFELGRIKNSAENLGQSLECYNDAIRIDLHNSLYFVKRSELHAHMGNVELAVADIKIYNTLPVSDDFTEIYLKNTVYDIARLTSVQDTITRLMSKGEISESFANAFIEHVKVTESLVVVVGDHSERITELETTMEQWFKASKHERAEIEQKFMEQEARIEKSEFRIMQLELVLQEEFETLLKKFSKLEVSETLFEGRLRMVEGKLEGQDKLLVTIDKALHYANVYLEEEIKKGFEQLKKEAPNEILYKYANSFHWFLSNYLLAYRAIGSKLIAGERVKGEFEEMWSKVGGTVMHAMEIVPVVGGALTIIESGISILNDTYQGLKFDRKVEKINSIITQLILEKDLSLAVASAAVQIARAKQAEILSQEKAMSSDQGTEQVENNLITKITEKFNKKIDKWITKASKISKTEITPAQEMAIKDVILFINYIATHDNALNVTNQGQDLDKAIANLFCNNLSISTSNALLQAAQQNQRSQNSHGNKSGKKEDNCIVCKLDQITYDNELLNHPNLIKLATSYYGSNKVIDLGSKLSQELMEEVVAGERMGETVYNLELLLAGLMSLDQESVML